MARRPIVALLSFAMLLVLPTPVSTGAPRGTKVQTYKGGLSFPVDMAWVRGTKKIFFTEKNSGRVRVMKGRRLLVRPCVDLAVDASGESGALGIALHPKFKENHYLYVYYTNNSPHENRVTRFTVVRNRCRNARHIVTGLSAGSQYHNGGQIEFLNGLLYVATGEVHNAGLAQDRSSRQGKILRLRANGRVPDGNPFNNAVWSYGHRNPFGLARSPSGKLYQSENGPNCDDEVNLIRKGRNYGWGSGYRCGTAGVGPNPKPPIRRYSSIIVPTDMTWYTGKLRLFHGLLMGDFGNGRLHRFILNAKENRVRQDRIVHNSGSGILDVAEGPGGWVYYLTSGSIMRIVRS
ncbi:MAG: PQQ-dependent sugar dehydrogenase [Actinomycetota bacterium]